jgi:flagellin
MSLNSVNTNMDAMVALQSLETTQTQLASTQKQISTGYRVADSTDDGAAYAIAQGVRSTVGGLTSANQQLGNVQGLLNTTQTALNNVSNMMGSMRDVLVKLSDSSVQGQDRLNYITQYTSMLSNVANDITGATYENKSLIGNLSSTTDTAAGSTKGTLTGATTYGFGTVSVVQDGGGDQYTIASQGASGAYSSIAFGTASTGGLGSAAFVQGLLGPQTAGATSGGVFTRMQNSIATSLNQIGSNINYVNNQTTFNNDKIDALNSGLGSLVDADLAKESAQLTALQIRQQLGTQALSLANQAPQTLLSLFK